MNTGDNKPDMRGHRKKMKVKFLKDSLSLDDKELLELMLHYAIPRKDTSKSAEMLLKKYGDIQTVFSAAKNEILSLPGLGENSAVLITLIKLLSDIIYSNKSNRRGRFIKTTTDAISFIKKYNNENKVEKFYALALSKKYEFLDIKLLSEGDAVSAPFNLKDVVRFAVINNAEYLILTHNHIDDNFLPSKEDIEITALCAEYLKMIDVYLVDHIIIANNDTFSFSANKLLKIDLDYR